MRRLPSRRAHHLTRKWSKFFSAVTSNWNVWQRADRRWQRNQPIPPIARWGGEKNRRRGSKLNSGSQAGEADFLSSIASARQEAQTLFELIQELGTSLSLNETLSLVSAKLRKLTPYDSIAVFVRNGDHLLPEFVSGENFRQLTSLRIPVGEGLCGWVARNSKPIINGNPAVEWGYAADPRNGTELRSALAVPLVGLTGLVGVLALYQTEADAFTSDHLRVLQVITSKIALSIENALKYRQVESSATVDYLTGLPNARALFLHLEKELTRCERDNSTAAVMVCDMDGFKQINDHYGHLEGDKALKLFATLAKDVCRGYDYVARMGGDEFVFVITNVTAEAAEEKAMLLNSLAQRAGRQICGKDLLSLSVGTAFYRQDGSNTEQLLAAADRNMYAVKQLHHEHPELAAPLLGQYSQLVSLNYCTA